MTEKHKRDIAGVIGGMTAMVKIMDTDRKHDLVSGVSIPESLGKYIDILEAILEDTDRVQTYSIKEDTSPIGSNPFMEEI